MTLRRPRYEMPSYAEEALTQRGLIDAYRRRPPYQQNDYVGWITTAKRTQTRNSRLSQMLDELRCGDVYMKAPYRRKS